MNDYLKKRQQHIFDDRPLPPKKTYKLKPISDKRAAKEKERKEVEGEISLKEVWFQARRQEMTGMCGCGCGMASSKYRDATFRNSCCHILPQRIFKSVALHPLNFVERNWDLGCHANMDNRSLDLWPKMADWANIKRRFRVLAQLLTKKEKATKFYSHLSRLVYGNE